MATLLELILTRRGMQLELLDLLLDFTSHEVPEVRDAAIKCTKVLHARPHMQDPIEVRYQTEIQWY